MESSYLSVLTIMRKIWFPGLALLTSGGIFFLDLASKNSFFRESSEATLLPNLLSLTTHKNMGALANIPLPLFFILLISFLAFALLLILLRRALQQQKLWQIIFLSLVIGGALGNLFDRLTLGFVRDWLLLFERSAINLADASILIGIGGYLLSQKMRWINKFPQ